MPKNNENFNKELEGFLRAQGIKKIATLDTNGEAVPDSKHADQFKFHYRNGDFDYGTVTVTTDDGKVTVYFNESVVRDPERGIDTNWTKFLMKLKDWSLRNGQMGFQVRNLDELGNQMRKRKIQKEEEKLLEGYYGTKHTSYNDNNPKIKMIIKHNKALDENDQRFRYIDKIFLENEVGERLLVPTKKPSVGRAFARHLAEGGEYNDDRWKHIYEIAEDLSKLSGFVRATKSNQFNESVIQIVNEATEHYLKLKETLHKIQGSRGYHQYFESYKPSIMENDVEHDYSNMFMTSRLDPRIESAFPVLSKLNIRANELSEANEFEDWANSIVEGRSPELDKKIEDLLKILNNSEKVAVGADAMNIKGQLDDIIDDDGDKDQLYAELEKVAHADPDHDAKPVIVAWLQERSDDKFYGDVLDKMETSTPSMPETEPEIATNPAKEKSSAPAQPTPAGEEIPEPSPQDAKAAQQFMPQPLAEKAKKPAQRNFVAKHAQRSGAGSHGKKGFQRHDKHKKKLGEEGVAEGSSSKLSSPFEGGRKTTSITPKHKPLVWENMLGTVMAKDPASKAEPKYFDYKWDDARAYAKVDQCDDLRICKSPGLYQGWPEKGKMALWGILRKGVAEGYKEPIDAAGHAKMAAKIKRMLDDTLADRGDRHGNPDPQRLIRAYEYHMEKAKEKSQGVLEDQLDELKCWDGYKRVPGTKAGEPGSCEKINEFSPGGSGGDDILKTLAAQWLNGDVASGDLDSDIQSQEKIERRLEKGVTCPDGVKRKLYIDYNEDYDGVVIYSDDDWSIEYKQDDLNESNIDESLSSIKRLSGLK